MTPHKIRTCILLLSGSLGKPGKVSRTLTHIECSYNRQKIFACHFYFPLIFIYMLSTVISFVCVVSVCEFYANIVFPHIFLIFCILRASLRDYFSPLTSLLFFVFVVMLPAL